MKVAYLRWIDKYLGLVLSFILLAPAGLNRKKIPPSGQKRIDRILIIKLWGFGSIVLMYDFFQNIRKSFPGASLCAFTFRQNSQVFKITGIFDEIYELDITDLKRSVFSFIFQSIKVIWRLRRKSFNISFDLEFTSRLSAVVSFLINAEQRIGFYYEGIWRGNFYTKDAPFHENQKLESSLSELLKIFRFKAPIFSGSLNLKIPPEDQLFVENLLKKQLPIDVKPLVGVNINASDLCLLRRWPREYFVALIGELISNYSAHIIFIGSREDIRYVDSTLALFSSQQRNYVHNFSGKFSVVQLACLLKKMHFFISNDSGPLHLAVYLGIPTVSFFGPETPLIYGPEGDLHTVFYRNLPCSPCIRIRKYKFATCAYGQRCLREITPEQVLNEIKRKGIF
jgi:ADP-heptose:LPS heptosyltransferase